MKKFLIQIFGFSLVMFLLFSAMTFITDSGMHKSEFGNLKEWNEIFEKKINADIIIQGSSRAWVQFDTYIIDSVFNTNSYNMGIDGSPFDVQYVRYKSYIENNKYPKVILQNVDWDLMDKNTPVFQKYQFLPFLGNHYFKEQLLKNNIIPFSDCYLPFLKYSGQPKALEVGFSEFFGIQHYKSLKHKGYAGSDENWNGNNFENRKKGGKFYWKKDPKLEKMFIDFVLDCKSKNIKVVLVFAPVYFELADLMVNFNELKLFYKDYAQKYNLVFLDYSLIPLSDNKEHFINATHLNKRGSEIFTTQLANELKDKNIVEVVAKK